MILYDVYYFGFSGSGSPDRSRSLIPGGTANENIRLPKSLQQNDTGESPAKSSDLTSLIRDLSREKKTELLEIDEELQNPFAGDDKRMTEEKRHEEETADDASEKNFNLEGVIISSTEKSAVINGVLVHEKEFIDGFEVAEISKDAALLRNKKGDERLLELLSFRKFE